MKTHDIDTCPNCGNTNPDTIEDNGAKRTSEDFGQLCVARVDPKDWAYAGDSAAFRLEPEDFDADGKVKCAMQWYPNA